MTLSLFCKNDIVRCIHDCLSQESLSDLYTCDKCSKKSKAKVRHEFVKLPKVLILHIKRFAQSGGKIENMTKYPEDLNML